MPSLENEALERVQHILNLPHERKNMTLLVTTPNLVRAGFLSPNIGTKVGFKVFRDGKPLVDRKHKYSKKRPREPSPDDSLDQGMIGRAPTSSEGASYIFFFSKIILALHAIPVYLVK